MKNPTAPCRLAYVATLACKLMLENKRLTINYEVVLRCGGVVNTGNKIKKGLLLSLNFFKEIDEYSAKLHFHALSSSY